MIQIFSAEYLLRLMPLKVALIDVERLAMIIRGELEALGQFRYSIRKCGRSSVLLKLLELLLCINVCAREC